MAAASDISPQSGYIQHHLVHLNNVGEKQDVLANFGVINYDSMFWSLLMGLVVVFFLWRAASVATAGVPGRLQSFVEMLVDWVEDQAKSIVPNAESRKFVSPLALTVFLWIIMMNILDLLPVDGLGWIFIQTGLAAEHGDPLYYHRILPTADLNVPMGMSMGVLDVLLRHQNQAPRRLCQRIVYCTVRSLWPDGCCARALQLFAELHRIRRQVCVLGYAIVRQYVCW